jgi:hypothetical protein
MERAMQSNQQQVDRIERELIEVKAQIDASRRPAVTGFDFGAPRAADGTAWTVDAENPEYEALKARYRELADDLAEAAQMSPSAVSLRLIELAKPKRAQNRLERIARAKARIRFMVPSRHGDRIPGATRAAIRRDIRTIRRDLAALDHYGVTRVGSMVYCDGVVVGVDPHPVAYEIEPSEPPARPVDPPRNRFGEPCAHGAGAWGR